MDAAVVVMPELPFQVHHYKIIHLLGRGQFGTVYAGHHVETGHPVAVKMAIVDTTTAETSAINTLRTEARVLQHLSLTRAAGVPELFWFGMHSHSSATTPNPFRYIVMQQVGMTLTQWLRQQHPHPHPGTSASTSVTKEQISFFAKQMLTCLESIHDREIVHRDIKLDNWAFRSSPSPSPSSATQELLLCLIDFGMAKATPKTTEPRQTGVILGTPSYASLFVHAGMEPTRRDDVESCLYCLLQLHLGSLPWANAASHADMCRQKRQPLSSSSLIPFQEALTKVRALAFQERPRYGELWQNMRGEGK